MTCLFSLFLNVCCKELRVEGINYSGKGPHLFAVVLFGHNSFLNFVLEFKTLNNLSNPHFIWRSACTESFLAIGWAGCFVEKVL